MTSPKIAVELQRVTKNFGTATVVDDVSLQIMDNEFFSILGPSGCGKTTLMRMIAGFEQPTTGEIMLGGKPIADLPAHQRDLNMVFQSYALFPHLNVEQNIGFELRQRKRPKSEVAKTVAEMIDQVRLNGFERRKPAELSGGQRQRVALARALASQPTLVLLDEPLGALDQQLRKEMQRELKRLQRESGITFVYVTHDQDEAMTMSDRIAVMKSGQLLQVASPRELYREPSAGFTAGFIGVTNLFSGSARSGGAEVDVEHLGSIPVGSRDDLAGGQAVTVSIRPEQVAIAKSHPQREVVRTGIVRDVVFLGSHTEYVVAIEAVTVLARVANTEDLHGTDTIAIGDTVSVGWNATSARVLSA